MKLLNSLKVKNYFDVILTAAEVSKSKPAPDVFLVAAKRLQIRPKNCIVVKDAPVGIESAIRVDMKSIALTTTHDKNELTSADLIVKDLSNVSIADILKILEIE